MRKSAIFLVAAIVVTLAAGIYIESGGAADTAANADGASATAQLRDAAGNRVGFAKLTQRDGDVVVKVRVHDLAPGFHGFHVHTIGACTPDFGAAGGHFNPGGANHPNHAADMPVLLVKADGTGEARFDTDRYRIEELFDADGSALMIHANPDNYANIPTDRYDPDPDASTLSTGDAGSRIACAVLEGN